MSFIHLYRFVFFMSLFSWATCITAQNRNETYLHQLLQQQDTSQPQQQPQIIITTMPEPKEVVSEPQGYVSCSMVEGSWLAGVWHPEHRVCRYNRNNVNTYQGDVWVAPHWACTQYKIVESTRAECTNWQWKPGHWGKSNELY